MRDNNYDPETSVYGGMLQFLQYSRQLNVSEVWWISPLV